MTVNEMPTKSNYHLFAGLDVLHCESREWLGNIAFWQDEIKFLQKLIRENTSGRLPKPINEGFRKAGSGLERLATDELPGLFKAIEEHKLQLEFILEDRSSDKEIYRRKIHKDMLENMRRSNMCFRNLKNEIFELAEEVTIVNYNTGAHYWKGYTYIDRHKAVSGIAGIIGRYGKILASNIFSDIEISFIIETEGKMVTELYNELSKILKLDEEKLDAINPYKDCKIFLNITFADASGNIKVDPGGNL